MCPKGYPEPELEHGKTSTYSNKKCRCDECRAAQAAYCREWRRDNLERARANERRWRDKNPEKIRAKYLKRRERITPEDSRRWQLWSRYRLRPRDFDALWETQAGKCGACSKDLLPLGRQGNATAIDHCHNSDKIRGLLCNRCNRVLGMCNEDVKVFQGLAKYLKIHKK